MGSVRASGVEHHLGIQAAATKEGPIWPPRGEAGQHGSGTPRGWVDEGNISHHGLQPWSFSQR